MQEHEISTVTLESACAILLLAIAYKLYNMRCASRSKCCGDHASFESDNPGPAEGAV
jgi:hypothetical protein